MRARVFVSHTPNTRAEEFTKFFGGGEGGVQAAYVSRFTGWLFKSDTFCLKWFEI